VGPAQSQAEPLSTTSASDLVAQLELPLPASLPVGTATAIFCFGTCFHSHEPIEDLELVLDGRRHRPAAFRMPRPDMPRSTQAGPHSYLSGFWATVPIERHEDVGTIELQAAARLADGRQLVAPLGRIALVERDPPPGLEAMPEQPGPGLIAVCMATFGRDMDLFRTQVESLRAQSDKRWVCLISDDCSSDESLERIEQVVGSDGRFVLSRSERRLGFYRNFERALRMTPGEAELLALCDQDDRWHPDKLEVLRAALGSARLVYSDQRLVERDGRLLRETLWQGRRNNHENLASMLIANAVTGAAALFRRELLDVLLPFPETPGFQFHDHWLGVAALATGELAYVDRPLYDYVQHPGAVFGDVTHGRREGGRRFQGPRGAFERWRGAYFYGYLAREVQAQTLLVRGGPQLTEAKRRVLRRFVASGRSPAAFAWLAGRRARSLVGRTETLGSETQFAQGVLWRWLIGLAARRARGPGRISLDAGFPPPDSFNQRRLRRWRAQV